MKVIEFSISHFFEFIKKNVYFFLKNVQNCGMMRVRFIETRQKRYSMTFAWRDYTEADAPMADGWLDEEAIRHTGLDDGFDDCYRYWKEQPEIHMGENLWGKLFSVGDTPVGVCLLGMENGVLTVSELLIDPVKRGNGYGSAALKELLEKSGDILDKRFVSAKAVI